MEPGQFTLISMRLIRNSRSHISGPLNRFPPNLGCGCFLLCSTDTCIHNAEIQTEKNVMSSLLYSICKPSFSVSTDYYLKLVSILKLWSWIISLLTFLSLSLVFRYFNYIKILLAPLIEKTNYLTGPIFIIPC